MVQARILGTDPLQKLACRLLMPIGYRMADLKSQKQTPRSVVENLRSCLGGHGFYFRPLKKSLGLSKARICYSTGAIPQSGGLPILPGPEYSLKESVLFHRGRTSDRDQE